MRLLRNITVSVVILSMLGLMPGLECYQAAAQAFQASPVTSKAVGGYNGVSGAVKGAVKLGGSTPLQLNNFSLTGTAALLETPNVTAKNLLPPITANGAASVSAAARDSIIAPSANDSRQGVPQGAAQTALQGLLRQMPDFSKMGAESKAGADTDFMQRVGGFKTYARDADLTPGGSVMGRLETAKGSALKLSFSRSSKKTPDSPEEAAPGNNSPDARPSEDVDGSGNAPRPSEGPDSVPDEFGGSQRGAAVGLSLAAGFLPAIAAAGLKIGQQLMMSVGPVNLTPNGAIPASSVNNQAGSPVDVIVMLKDGSRALTQDVHLSAVNLNLPNSVEVYAQTQRSLLLDIEAAGIGSDVLAGYDATPIASYKRINAATIRVDAARAEEFKALLRSQGHKVYDNSRREIIRPVPANPESVDPEARGSISMSENLQLTKADKVQAEARKLYGAPEMGFLRRLWSKITGAQAPQPLIGVIDTGVDLKHPQLKRVKEMKNATNGPNVDDNGHGSWVTSMVLNFAPWLKSVTHYKTFVDGGANLDDILKALTMAGNDGNLVISNSWGSDDGDPTGPDSVLVKKLAEEGHIMVFAAGNAGPNANTVGSPAIVTYKDAATGAIRVVSVAAADRTKKIAYFSSRGPGSEKTKTDPNYPHRPDLTGLGYNTDGAWPTDVGGADRVDPELGPLKAISGTSMSTPSIAGAIALLAMMFGVTEKGAKLDAVINAVMATLEKTGQPRDAEGEGFLNVNAAYQALKAALAPARAGRGR